MTIRASPKFFISNFLDTIDGSKSTGVAFRNSFYDLTIEVGTHNDGAIALNYIANNEGTISDVTLRSVDGHGLAGLGLLSNWPGPALVRNLRVEGFARGVWSDIRQYSLTFDNLTLVGQSEAGIVNEGQIFSIRGLHSDNAVPAIINRSADGLTVLVDSDLRGGSKEHLRDRERFDGIADAAGRSLAECKGLWLRARDPDAIKAGRDHLRPRGHRHAGFARHDHHRQAL